MTSDQYFLICLTVLRERVLLWFYHRVLCDQPSQISLSGLHINSSGDMAGHSQAHTQKWSAVLFSVMQYMTLLDYCDTAIVYQSVH